MVWWYWSIKSIMLFTWSNRFLLFTRGLKSSLTSSSDKVDSSLFCCSNSTSSSGIRFGLVRKSNEALSEGVSVSKSNSEDGMVVVVGGGGGKVGHVLALVVVFSIDFDSTSSASSSYLFLQFYRKKIINKWKKLFLL